MMDLGAPVFVVGLPRSGTTLLAAMLGAHSRLDCGPETHFFSHLQRARSDRILTPRTWPRRGVELITSIVVGDTPVHHLFDVSTDELEAFLAARPPSVQVLLESLTAIRAARHRKARWIEKTPNHLLHVEKIRSLYPE